MIALLKRAFTELILLPIYFYRYCISPLTPPSCRFTPTCSQYAVIAIKKYGVFKGGWLTLKRLSKCRPGGGHGYDPVP
jgi:putative membrane protein insertion efficiency factor